MTLKQILIYSISIIRFVTVTLVRIETAAIVFKR